MTENRLYYGDNLQVLRNEIAPESVDLIYLDPPFNSKTTYNVLFSSPTGHYSQAQIEAFEDTWHWTEEAEHAFDEVMESGNTNAAEMLRAMRQFLGENDMMAYLTMMAIRLIQLHRVLKDTGSIYLHCDPTASHYLKILLDGIFGPAQFRNEVVWVRSRNPKGSQHKGRRYGPGTDSILYYAKSDKARLYLDKIRRPLTAQELTEKYDRSDNKGPFLDGPILRSSSMGNRSNLVYEYNGFTPGPAGWRVVRAELENIDDRGDLGWSRSGAPRRKWRPQEDRGDPIGSLWEDIPPINSQAQERLGYPTQKPLALLERIIQASSNEGDVVLDPFCGCGTAVHAAEKLKRKWIGIDITHLAVSLVEKRLKDAFPAITYEVHGTPKDLAGAEALAAKNKFQFEWWAVSLVNAVPYGGKKRGADSGIDGLIYFKPDGKKTERAIVSVKGGKNVGVAMIRDLGHVVEREKAKIGIFVTLAEPTGPMKTEAVKAGFYETDYGKFPKIQILTIEDLLAGKKLEMPWLDPTAFKKAAKEDTAVQHNLI